jgi:hypothetical protein
MEKKPMTLPRPSRLPLFGIGLAVLFTLGPLAPAAAQQRGDTQSVPSSLPFASGSQSVWGPSNTTPDPFTFPLFDAPVGVDLDEGAFQSWQGLKFGGSVEMSASARIGMNFVIETMPGGSLSVTYPVDANVVFPAPNTFRPGEPVTISTSWALGGGSSLSSEAPETRLSIRGPFSSNSSVGGEICVLQCTSLSPQSLNAPASTINFFSVGDAGIGVGDQFQDIDRWDFTFVEKFLLGISGFVEVPRAYPSGTGSGTTISAHRNQTWLDINWDLDTFLSRIGVLQAPGGIGINAGAVAIGYNVWDLDQDLNFSRRRNFDFEGAPRVTVTFPVAMPWFVNDAGDNQIDAGTGTTVTFDVGNSLDVIFPAGRVEPITGSPAYTLPNTLDSHEDWTYAGNMRDTLLNAELKFPAKTGSVDLYVETGSHWDCGVAQALCDGVSQAVGITLGYLNKIIDYGWRTFSHAFGAVDEKWGPAQADVFAEFSATEVTHDSSWELPGFPTLPGASFTLDPEDPRISATTWVANALLTTGANPGNVLQTITVTNDGDVKITLADVLDELSATGLTVESITSGDVTVNAGFDGSIDFETLASGMIAVGSSVSITVREAAPFGMLHFAEVEVAGTSPIGTQVTAYAETSFAVFDMDLNKSNKLKLRKSGKGKSKKVKARLYGSPNLDVTTIDWRSLNLEGARPKKAKVKSGKSKKAINGVVYPMLEVEFSEPAIIEGLQARLAAQAGAGGSLAPISITPSFAPVALPNEIVAAALLDAADRRVSKEDRTELDRQGNANGRFDIGDLRAQVVGDDSWFDVVASKGKKKKKKSGKSEKTPLPTYTIVVVGTMNDGTPLFGETLIELDTGKEND